MKVTKPMIERGAQALADYEGLPRGLCVKRSEAVLRAALNDPAEPARPMEGQTSIGVDPNGDTVVVDG